MNSTDFKLDSQLQQALDELGFTTPTEIHQINSKSNRENAIRMDFNVCINVPFSISTFTVHLSRKLKLAFVEIRAKIPLFCDVVLHGVQKSR